MLTAAQLQTHIQDLQALGSASEAQATEIMIVALAAVATLIALALVWALVWSLLGSFIRQALRWAFLGLAAAIGAALLGWGFQTVMGQWL